MSEESEREPKTSARCGNRMRFFFCELSLRKLPSKQKKSSNSEPQNWNVNGERKRSKTTLRIAKILEKIERKRIERKWLWPGLLLVALSRRSSSAIFRWYTDIFQKVDFSPDGLKWVSEISPMREQTKAASPNWAQISRKPANSPCANQAQLRGRSATDRNDKWIVHRKRIESQMYRGMLQAESHTLPIRIRGSTKNAKVAYPQIQKAMETFLSPQSHFWIVIRTLAQSLFHKKGVLAPPNLRRPHSF